MCLPVVVIRYYTLFGPRQRPDMLAHIGLKALAEDRPITVYGDGEQTRELTYVADAVVILGSIDIILGEVDR